MAKAEDDLKKAQDKLHLNLGDKILADEECRYTEIFKRTKKEWESALRKKAKLNWLALGDENTRYFHQSIQHRRKCNAINVLHLQDGTTSNPRKIQEAFQKYYTKLLGCIIKERAKINMNIINRGPTLTHNQQNLLTLSFSLEDIKEVTWSIPEDKASRLDGFNSGFYKAAWDIVGADVVAAVQEFFAKGTPLNSWNTTTITLIPKVTTPNTPGDYRPISCCNVINKCNSKIICRKFFLVLGSIISLNQGAFVEGRNILHNILLCQDIVKQYVERIALLAAF